ncbi:MAG: GDP-mannose 4,6-dehydratase [Candidatus Omnitrophota bacterium]
MSKMKKAIIVGCAGQDGRILFDYLSGQGYSLAGIDLDGVRTEEKGLPGSVDISSPKDVEEITRLFQPDEVYYLAAAHHSSEDLTGQDGRLFEKSLSVNVLSLVNFLDALRRYSNCSRLFYAASSHVFGRPARRIQDETTPYNPRCIYGITKAAGAHACHFYRDKHHIPASVGILYNHESPLRARKFVSQKIVHAAIAIKKGRQDTLVLGSLDAVIDWGYAPDYVEAMYKILQYPHPEDFIVSSGSTHSVGDFVKEVFGYLDLDWKKHVQEDPGLITKEKRNNLRGDSAKLRKLTGWRPKVSFSEMIKIMVNEAGKGKETKGAFNG